MRLIASISLIFCLATNIVARDAAGGFETLRQALDGNDNAAAAAELRSIESAQPAVFAANNLDYLLGRTLEMLGDAAGAARSFESVRSRNSLLKNYALWHLSDLARSSGNLFLERLYLMELAAYGDAGLTCGAAQERLAESFFESGDFAASIRILTGNMSRSAFLPQKPGVSYAGRSRKRRLLLAKARQRAGETAEASRLFDELLESTPNPEQPDDFALAAVRGLDDIDSAGNSPLTNAERFRRAGVYQFNRDFEPARKHYLTLLNESAPDSTAAKAVFRIGRGYAMQENFVEAVKWFERGVEQADDAMVAKDSLLQAASAYARLGKRREAVLRYQTYIQMYPNDERGDRAYLNIIDVLRDAGEDTAALQQAQKTQEIFRGKQAEALAMFSEVRIYISRGDWPSALASLEKLASRRDLGGASVPGGTNSAEVAFLKGYALEQTERFAEAVDAYLLVPDGWDEYYGWLATERLRQMSSRPASKFAVDQKLAGLIAESKTSDTVLRRRAATAALRIASSDEARKSLFANLAQAYSKSPNYAKFWNAALPNGVSEVLSGNHRPARDDPHKTLAQELIFLGLYDEAAPEFEAGLLSGLTGTPGGNRQPNVSQIDSYTLAVLYLRGNRPDRASAFFRPLTDLPDDFQPEMLDPDLARFEYPVVYTGAFLQTARPRGVDPRLLLSIIRQESGFRPYVKSNAAARGLMQFISTTSDRIAQSLGLSDFADDDLFDPRVSLLFGSQYVQQLLTLFPDPPEAAVAAYNGGEENMKRWLARSKSRVPELYVPEIAFAQTKDYVFRVMSNYRVYQTLYDENLDPKPAAYARRGGDLR